MGVLVSFEICLGGFVAGMISFLYYVYVCGSNLVSEAYEDSDGLLGYDEEGEVFDSMDM